MKSPEDYAAEALAAWHAGRQSLRDAIVEAVREAVAEVLAAGQPEAAHDHPPDQTAVVGQDGLWYRRGPDGTLTPLERRAPKPISCEAS